MELEALFDAVIVKPLEEEETQYGSIVVPDLGKDRNEHGIVIAVGPGKETVTGTFIPTKIKAGDKVILPTMGFTKLQHEGDEYFIGPENQILARINTKTSVEDALEQTEVSDEDFDAIKSLD
jgi:chaperonin GroES|tara:strand:- start:155 stop:520 length:366 start_codon:yes stop_codon:yes gene_type:complete